MAAQKNQSHGNVGFLGCSASPRAPQEVASEVDVLYQTRIQKERFGDRISDYEAARGKYIVDKAVMDCMKKNAVVMHPLPRLDEITVDVDADPRAAYFRQVRAGGRCLAAALLRLYVLLLLCGGT